MHRSRVREYATSDLRVHHNPEEFSSVDSYERYDPISVIRKCVVVTTRSVARPHLSLEKAARNALNGVTDRSCYARRFKELALSQRN